MAAYCIGLAGPTASGKSTLARVLQQHLGIDRCVLFELDWYYYDIPRRDTQDYSDVNFDHPDAIESIFASEQLQALVFLQNLFPLRYIEYTKHILNHRVRYRIL